MQMHEIFYEDYNNTSSRLTFYCEGNGSVSEGIATWVSVERGESVSIPVARIYSVNSKFLEVK